MKLILNQGDGKFAFVNCEIVEKADAFLHISDLAIQRGYGVFDFFKVMKGVPMFLDFHLDRFFHSASVMKLQAPVDKKMILENVYALLAKNQLPESGIKLILTGGYSTDGYSIATPNLIITQHEVKMPQPEVIQNGIAIITYPYSKEFPQAKTINYSMGIWLSDLVKSSGAYDVLYHDQGIISEFPRSNVFLVTRDGTLVTPSNKILEGITRKNILALAREKFSVEERDVTLSELYEAKEVFLTSTTKRIIPVVAIDNQAIADKRPGPIAQTLLGDLINLENSFVNGRMAKN